MDIRDQFPSKYVRAAQVASRPGGTVRVQIKRLSVERMRARGGAQEEKPVLYFERAEKGMVLNRTNADVIGAAFGWETDAWRGHVVELYVAEVEAFGEVVDAIRVRVPKAAPKHAPARPQTQPIHPEPAADPAPELAAKDELFPEPGEDSPEPGELDADGNPF